MYGKRGPGVPLRDRGRLQATATEAQPAPLRPAGHAPATRHAWATLELNEAPVPALVVSWHRSAMGWQAWVVVVINDQAATRYLPAAQLRPAHTPVPLRAAIHT